jgi:hypothetical protein
MRNIDAAQPQRPTGCKLMGIVTDADASALRGVDS